MASQDNGLVVEEARSIVASHERREAMDAALEIVATTTKQRLDQEVTKATDARNLVNAICTEAKRAWMEAASSFAKTAIYALPLTKKIIDVVEALSDATLTPEEVWPLVDVDYDGKRHLATGTTFFDVEIERDQRGGTTTISPGSFEVVMSDKKCPGMVELRAAVEAAEADRKLKQEALEAVRLRRDAHKDSVDCAKVQLQRQKLESMGEAGKAVLDRVDKVLGAADGDNYLQLL